MKAISPIIATILLIVMTIGIAALMYAWLTGLFTTLSNSASNTANQLLSSTIEFNVPQAFFINASTCYVEAIIYNNPSSRIPINTSDASYVLNIYSTATGSLSNTLTSYTVNSVLIPPGSQQQVDIQFNGGNCSDMTNYYYVLSVVYNGVSSSATVT